MLKKKYLSTAIVTMLLVFGAGSAMAAELKIAYVKMNTLLVKSKPASALIARLKKEFGPRESKFKSKIKKLKSMKSRLRTSHRVMSKSQLITLQRKIRSLQRDMKRDNVENREDFALRRNEEGVKLQKLIFKAIVKVAKRDKYDLVLRQGVAYHSKRIDITAKIMAELAK